MAETQGDFLLQWTPWMELPSSQEWPWCDYTWQGKAIGTFLNFMSIGCLANVFHGPPGAQKKKV